MDRQFRVETLGIFLLLTVGGCGAEPGIEGQDALHYADLPGLQATSHPGLKAEYARLRAERVTPKALSPQRVDENGRAGWLRPDGKYIPDRDNIAQALDDVCSEDHRDRLLERIYRVCPRGQFNQSLKALALAKQVREEQDDVRRRFEVALSRSKWEFGLQQGEGLLLDMSPIRWIELGAKLESLRLAEMLQDQKPQEALQPLAFMLRAAAQLDHERHFVPRMAAVHIRREACEAMQAMVIQPSATADTQRTLHALLTDQLRRWPPDHWLLEGERAQALHTYELIRDGYILSVLNPEEFASLARDVPLENVLAQVVANIDQDQMFYLSTLRRLLDASEQPFHRRVPLYEDVRRKLEKLRPSGAYPWIADRILLGHLEQAQREQARDRALCEGWHLALTASLLEGGMKGKLEEGARQGQPKTNPETGQPYRIDRQPDRVIVQGAISADTLSKKRPQKTTIVVPRLVSERANGESS